MSRFSSITAKLVRTELQHDGNYCGALFENVGRGNVVFLPRTTRLCPFSVNLSGRSGNTLIFGERCNLRRDSLVTIEGDNHTLTAMGGGGTSRVNFTMRGNGGELYYGYDCTANEINVLVFGEASAKIQDDCLFSWGIHLRTFDSHAIIDCATRQQINHPQNIVIGPHSWIGQGAIIMPGVKIGSGSIVGAGSIVTRSVPDRSLAVGVPAKVIREGVTWTREALPESRHIDAALARMENHDHLTQCTHG